MEAILLYLAEHWLKWLFAICTTGLGWLYRKISESLKEEQHKNRAIADGVRALLRENIIDNYHKYTERGWCPIYARESISRLYEAYANLEGNDVASGLYRQLMDLPTKDDKPQVKEDEKNDER